LIQLLDGHSGLIVLLILTSIVTGFAAGLFGIGGGAILVPVLFVLFSSIGYADTAMHVALATSLATIILTSVRSVYAHHKNHAVDWSVLKLWTPSIMFGAMVGQITASHLSAEHLTIVFAILAYLLSVQLMLGSPDWNIAPDLPSGMSKMSIGSSIGFFSTLMGIGGGVFGVTLMTSCGRTIRQAVGTAAGFGAGIGLPSALTAIYTGWEAENLPPFSLGYVNLTAFLLISVCTVSVAPYGAKAAHSMSPITLRRAFGLLLAIVATRMIWVALVD